MIDMVRKQYPQYADMSDEDLTAALMRKFGTVNHESLDGPGVVTAETSHELQQMAPNVKPVVKGTKAEVLRMKQTGRVAPGSIVFTMPDDTAYIIDPDAVQAIYGGSKAEAVKRAKLDLRDGGDKESILLGYPKREGVQNPVSAAVDRGGNVITDLPEMKANAEAGNVLWAAEGEPGDVADKAGQVAQAIKNDREVIPDGGTEG
jgi:hypothetical protein